MFAGHTRKFLHTFMRGNNYQMVIHKLYVISTGVYPMGKKTGAELFWHEGEKCCEWSINALFPSTKFYTMTFQKVTNMKSDSLE